MAKRKCPGSSQGGSSQDSGKQHVQDSCKQHKRPEILARLRAGETLRAICRDPDMPAESRVRDWVAEDPAWAAQYVMAREIGYMAMADEIIEIADRGSDCWQRDRLRVDTRKWLLSKALPKIYGDRLEIRAERERPAIIMPAPMSAEEWVAHFGPGDVAIDARGDEPAGGGEANARATALAVVRAG